MAGGSADVRRRQSVRQIQPRWRWDRWTGRSGGRRRRTLRRTVALLLFLVAGISAGWQRTIDGGDQVLAVARDLPLGSTLQPSDVVVVRVLDPPDGVLSDPADISYRTLAGAVRRGELLTDARLVDIGGPDPGPGRVALTVRPADPAVIQLLRPGMAVAVVTIGPDGGAATLSSGGVVMVVLDDDSDRSGGSRPVLISVPLADGDRVTAGTLTGDIALRLG